MQIEIKKLYHEIQTLLLKLVPYNWSSIYLYASVLEGKQGEMYFYYFPKKLLKANPINCYEIPDKFGIEEDVYEKNLKKLYGYIKNLNELMHKSWTNTTISIKGNVFTIEYHYNNLLKSKYTDEQRRLVWCHKYLGIPAESMNLSDKMLIERYAEETNINPMVYSEIIDIKTDEEEDGLIPKQNNNEIRNPFLRI